MTRKRLTLIFVAILMMVLAVAQASAYVHQTIQTYSGYCSAAPGFAGLLQQLNLIPAGKCTTIGSDGTTCHDNAVCYINTPTGPTGHCFQVKGSNGKNLACKC